MLMRRILLLLFTFLSVTAFSQIHVKDGSFKKIEGFVMLDKYDHTDMNDRPMALIKISTENIKAEERARFEFKGNLATYFEVQLMTGEIYLYLSTAATFIEIIHPDFGKTEYWLPEDLCGFCGYEMVVVGDFKGEGEKTKELFNYLVISADQADAMIYIDGEYVGKNNIKEPLTIGNKYRYSVECPFYHTRSGEVTITEGDPVSIVVKMRPAFGALKIDANVDKTDVYIDGKLAGKTPYHSDMIASGEHDVELQKKGYPTKKQKVTISDGKTSQLMINMNAQGAIFVTANYAFSTAPQHSFGLTLGSVKKFGWYVSAMTGLSFDAMNAEMTCDELGYVDGEMQLYSDKTSRSRISLIAGVMFRPVDVMAIKLGAGYGIREYAQQTMGDEIWVRNEASSARGIDINAGLQFFVKKLSFSLDYVTTNAKYSEIKLGVGFCF